MFLSSRIVSHDSNRCFDLRAFRILAAEPLRLHVDRVLVVGGYAPGWE